MSFDIYFAGSQNKLAEDYMMKNGCNRLLSYYSDKSIIKSWVEFKKANENIPNKLFIDCGAYTAFTQGVTIDIDDYIQYINNISDQIDIFASLDIIGGGDVQDSDKKSYENYLYLKNHCKDKHKLLPTYHQGDDISYLEKYLQDPDIDYIALGGLVGSTRNILDSFFQTCYKIIQKVRPTINVHAFGMTSKPLLKSYPFKSADSTAWIMTSANGGVMSPWGVINISEKQDHLVKNYANMRSDEKEQVEKYLQSLGFTVQQCKEDYKVRCLVNIMYLQQFANNHERKLKGLKKSLF